MTDVGNLKVNIGLNSSKFQQGITNVNKQLKVAQAEFRNASSSLKGFGSATDKLKAKADYLNKSVELQKEKVTALKEVYEKAKSETGENSKKTQNLAIQYNYAQAKLNYLERDLKSTNETIKIQSSRWTQVGEKLKNVGSKMQDAGKKIASVGKNLSMKVTAPLVGVGTAAIKVGMDFNAGMSEVKAITNSTGEEFDKLNKQAKDLGSKTAFSAKQAAEGMKYLGMAGFSTNDIMKAMPGLLDLAAASGTDLGLTSDIVSDSLTAFGLKAEDTSHFADVLAKASSNANVSVETLGETFKYCAPVAGSLGFSMEEVTAAASVMGNAGIKASQAGTTLRTAMTNIGLAASGNSSIFKDLGVELKNTDGTMKSLGDILGQTKVAFDKMTDAEKASYAEALFGKNAMSGMLAIMNDNTDSLNMLTEGFKEADGTAGKMAATMQDNLKGSITKLKSALEGLMINLSETLIPIIERVVAKIQAWTDKFNALSPAQQELIVKIGLVVAAIGPVLLIIGKLVAVGGTLLTALGTISGAVAVVTTGVAAATPAVAGLAGAFTVVTGPIGIAIAAITAAIAIGVALYKNWGKIKAKAGELKIAISNKFSAIGNKIKDTWNNAKENTKQAWNNIKNTVDKNGGGIKGIIITATKTYLNIWKTGFNLMDKVTGGKLSDILNKVKEKMPAIKNNICNAWKVIKNVTTTVFNAIKTFLTTIWNAYKTLITIEINAIKTVITTVWNAIKTVTITIWNAIKTGITTIVTAIKTNIATIFNGVKTVITTIWEAIKKIAWEKAQAVKTAIVTPIEQAVEKVRTAVNKIKDFFSSVKDKANSAIDKIKEFNGMSVKDKVFTVTKRIKEVFVSAKSKINGSHANGLNRVPFDGYIAELHRDEMVLTARQAQQYRRNNVSNNNSRSITQNITINSPTQLSPSDIARQNRRTLQEWGLQF